MLYKSGSLRSVTAPISTAGTEEETRAEVQRLEATRANVTAGDAAAAATKAAPSGVCVSDTALSAVTHAVYLLHAPPMHVFGSTSRQVWVVA
jgi:hypothetical protein